MNDLQKLEYKNVKVLTSKQLAEAYGVSETIVKTNFNRNKAKYIQGKDYFLVSHSERCSLQIVTNSSTKRSIYLWTESGAINHAKSIGTEQAWAVFNTLKQSYFELKQLQSNNLIEPSIDIDKYRKENQYLKLFDKRLEMDEKFKEFHIELGELYDDSENDFKAYYRTKTDFRKAVKEQVIKLAFLIKEDEIMEMIKDKNKYRKQYKSDSPMNYLYIESMDFMIDVYNRVLGYLMSDPSGNSTNNLIKSIDRNRERVKAKIKKNHAKKDIWENEEHPEIPTELINLNDRIDSGKAKRRIDKFVVDKENEIKSGQLTLFDNV